jgi:hypothetical protein
MGGDCGASGASTAAQQAALERAVAGIYGGAHELTLLRSAHAPYLLAGLRTLSAGHCGARSARAALATPRLTQRTALDAGRPWLVFWIAHSLALLEVPLPEGAAAWQRCRWLQRA